jgi:hypothetical protein
MQTEVQDAMYDGNDGAPLRVSRATETYQFALDTVLLIGKLQCHMSGGPDVGGRGGEGVEAVVPTQKVHIA